MLSAPPRNGGVSGRRGRQAGARSTRSREAGFAQHRPPRPPLFPRGNRPHPQRGWLTQPKLNDTLAVTRTYDVLGNRVGNYIGLSGELTGAIDAQDHLVQLGAEPLNCDQQGRAIRVIAELNVNDNPRARFPNASSGHSPDAAVALGGESGAASGAYRSTTSSAARCAFMAHSLRRWRCRSRRLGHCIALACRG